MAEPKFCIKCGANLSPGACYCPECGSAIEGTPAFEQQMDHFKEMRKSAMRSFLSFGLAIYVIPAVIAAIIMIIDAGNTASVLFGNSDFLHWRESHGFTFSESDLQTYIMCIGGMELASGLLAGATWFLVQKGVKRKVAMVCCILAAVLCVWSFVGMFLGFLMAWNVHDAKEIFTDEE